MATKPSLYIETSVISYLTARPSRDLVTAARQQITADWWATRLADYDVFVAPLVLDEASQGHSAAAEARLEVLGALPLVVPPREADALATALMERSSLPPKAAADVVHIAVATAAGAEYLLTWNFKHIANPFLRERINAVCRSEGFEPPILCTPEDLLEST